MSAGSPQAGDEDVLAPREGGSPAADQALLDFLFGN